MSYRLKLKEPLAEGVRRIAFEQIEIASHELRSNPDTDAAVHNARRALKRLRALLRFVRPGLGEDAYRRESQRLAEAGRLLSGERDRHVLRQTLRKLAMTASPPVNDDVVSAFDALLADGAGAAADPGRIRDQVVSRVTATKKFVSGDVVSGLEMKHAFAGIEKVYRKGRKLHRQCRDGASDEEFHGLRKSVQQHWRHMQLLSRAWPDALTARATEAKALSQLLGDDHDLSVLASFVGVHAQALPGNSPHDLRFLARQSQKVLRGQAHLHASRLFSERAEDLTERLQGYWDAAQQLSEIASRAESEDDQKPQPRALGLPSAADQQKVVAIPGKSRARRRAASA